MICFEVFVNGQRKCVAGVAERGVLTTILSWVKRDRHEADEGDWTEGDVEEMRLSVGGLTRHGEDSLHLEWLKERLAIGDEIVVKLVDRPACDTPISGRTDGIEPERGE